MLGACADAFVHKHGLDQSAGGKLAVYFEHCRASGRDHATGKEYLREPTPQAVSLEATSE